MTHLQYNENGWLFNKDKLSNEVHDVSEAELFDLIDLSYEEDVRSDQIRKQVEKSFEENAPKEDYVLEEARIIFTSGTMITYPFGDIISFDTKRHLYRGENRQYCNSIPTLNRKMKCHNSLDKQLIRAIEDLRIVQFEKFLFNRRINVVPYWEAMLCDVNYKALAQHYGFATHLLDLTNDFKTALFFATCKYDYIHDRYFPLSEQDIKSEEENYKYGMIFHAPDREIDYLNNFRLSLSLTTKEWPVKIDSGELDGVAFQIGYQPLYRCNYQNGYVFPMRTDAPLQNNVKFEKIRFRQSTELSQKVFELMHEGRDVFPREGINKVTKILRKMQNSYCFSEDDIWIVYDEEIDKNTFPTMQDFKNALQASTIFDEKVHISKEEVEYPIEDDMLQHINSQYDNKYLIDIIGGYPRMKPQQKMRRKAICAQIYGQEFADEKFGN